MEVPVNAPLREKVKRETQDLKGQQERNCNCRQLWVTYIDYICNIFSIVPFRVKLPESCPFPDQMPAVRQKALEVNEWCSCKSSSTGLARLVKRSYLPCLYRTFLGLFMVPFFPPLDFSMVFSNEKHGKAHPGPLAFSTSTLYPDQG